MGYTEYKFGNIINSTPSNANAINYNEDNTVSDIIQSMYTNISKNTEDIETLNNTVSSLSSTVSGHTTSINSLNSNKQNKITIKYATINRTWTANELVYYAYSSLGISGTVISVFINSTTRADYAEWQKITLGNGWMSLKNDSGASLTYSMTLGFVILT